MRRPRSPCRCGFRRETGTRCQAGWRSAVSGVTDRSSVPSGATHPIAFKFARKAGGIASKNDVVGTFSLSGSGALGRNIAGDTTVTFTLADAQLRLVVSASGDITATFTTDANLAGGGLDGDFCCHGFQSSANGGAGAVIGPYQFRGAERQASSGPWAVSTCSSTYHPAPVGHRLLP